MKRILSFSFLFLVSAAPAFARVPVINSLAVEVPLDGGLMVMGSRTWQLNKYIGVGLVAGGGQINRDFDLETTSGQKWNAETKAIIFPFVGPQVTLMFNWIGISVGYAAYYADTDLTVKSDTLGTLTGNTTGWGSGFYSPLLSLDFYDQKHDLVFGFGLGGFLGGTYPDLEAKSAAGKITTDESPIDTLTFHLKVAWADGRFNRLQQRASKDDF